MSAAALQTVASAAAATICLSAIGVAETAAELDELVKLVWRGNLGRRDQQHRAPRTLCNMSSSDVPYVVIRIGN